MDETLEESARRELLEETGLKPPRLEQIATFGDPGRDPRDRTISVVFLAQVPRASAVDGSDDAAEAKWFPLAKLPKLAFDHREILRCARRTLAGTKRRPRK